MHTGAQPRAQKAGGDVWTRLTLATAILSLTAYQTGADSRRQATNTATFDVASVKANRSGTLQANAGLQPNGVNLINLPLRGIIQLAYGIAQPSKLVGAPDWTVRERFDIVARA